MAAAAPSSGEVRLGRGRGHAAVGPVRVYSATHPGAVRPELPDMGAAAGPDHLINAAGLRDVATDAKNCYKAYGLR